MLTAKKMPQETVFCLVGGLGAGKTKIGVKAALKAYKKTLFIWMIANILLVMQEDGERVKMPYLYSNIPIQIKLPIWFRLYARIKNYKLDKFQFSRILTYEHIILIDRLREYSVIFIDEVGQFADQYKYDNPFVMQYIQEFFRFYRHWIDGRLVLTDQSSSNIVVAIRRRINTIYHLSEFQRKFIYFFKVNVETVLISEDMITVREANHKDQEFFSGYLPWKWFHRFDLISKIFSYKQYDSRCYKVLYDHVKTLHLPEKWTEFQTQYLIEIPDTIAMRKHFKQEGFISQQAMMAYVEEFIQAKKKAAVEEEKTKVVLSDSKAQG